MDYQFEHFQLSTTKRELSRAGTAIKLEPLVFDLLAYFVSQPQRVISRDELIKQVWRGRIVSDAAIDTRISAARHALGDDGHQQRYIQTVPRRGLRFVGTVAEQTPVARPAPDTQSIHYCHSKDGTAIAYTQTGNGPPLVRVGHWLTHLEYDWRSPIWVPFLSKLGSICQLTRYDQRGCGLSSRQPSAYKLEGFVEDLEAVVEATGLTQFALYGSSQGVPVAIAYAARHPERVSHLILQGGYALGRALRPDFDERAQGEAIQTLIRTGWGDPGGQFLTAFAAMYIPDGTREQIDALAELQKRSASPENAVSIRHAIDRFDVTNLLEKVQAPTLVLHARQDAIQPLEQGLALAQNIPNAQLQILESRNHVVLEQEAEWPTLFEGIRRFIDASLAV